MASLDDDAPITQDDGDMHRTDDYEDRDSLGLDNEQDDDLM